MICVEIAFCVMPRHTRLLHLSSARRKAGFFLARLLESKGEAFAKSERRGT